MKQRQIKAPDMPLAALKAPAQPKPVIHAPQDSVQEAEVAPLHLVETVVEAQPTTVPEYDEGDHGDWLMIPLSKLKIHPFNSRAIRTQERIEEVKNMLEDKRKQRDPITVVPGRTAEDSGFFYILSGQTRYHAANLAGWSELKAQINDEIDPDDHLSFWAASIEHNASLKETDWDLALKVKALLDENHPPELVQKASRKDARAIRRLMAMLELPESVLAVVREHPAKLSSHFCEALRSGLDKLGEDAIATIARHSVTVGMSHGALVDHIKREITRLERPAGRSQRARRQFMHPIVLGAAKQQAGAFKIMESTKHQGHRSVALTADIPDALVEAFKSDILAAIEKLTK